MAVNWREASAAETIERAETEAYVPQVTGTFVLVASVANRETVLGRPHESESVVRYRLGVERERYIRKGYKAEIIGGDMYTCLRKPGMKPVWLRCALTCTLPRETVATIH